MYNSRSYLILNDTILTVLKSNKCKIYHQKITNSLIINRYVLICSFFCTYVSCLLNFDTDTIFFFIAVYRIISIARVTFRQWIKNIAEYRAIRFTRNRHGVLDQGHKTSKLVAIMCMVEISVWLVHYYIVTLYAKSPTNHSTMDFTSFCRCCANESLLGSEISNDLY